MSSGISTSFPVLSLSMRQVAHALLTRPPLIRPRRDFTVRLECVMHAASVHPEPGSNSLKIVYSIRFCPELISTHQSDLVMLIYYKELLTLSKLFKFKRIFGVFFLVHLLLFNFQWAIRCRLSLTACILYHIKFRLSSGFLKVFYFLFSEPRSFLCFPVASRWQLSYYIISSQPCQLVFCSFFMFRACVHMP